MATLSGGAGARITLEVVEEEIKALTDSWRTDSGRGAGLGDGAATLNKYLSEEQQQKIDRFDLVQLEEVLRVCEDSRSLSDAGRTLFAASRQQKKSPNDADRLRKYLARFNLDWSHIHGV
jgi:transcriptional regulatory protein RtcR